MIAKTAYEIAKEHKNEKIAAYLKSIMDNKSNSTTPLSESVSVLVNDDGSTTTMMNGSTRKRLVSIVAADGASGEINLNNNNNNNNNASATKTSENDEKLAQQQPQQTEQEKPLVDELLLKSKFENAIQEWNNENNSTKDEEKIEKKKQLSRSLCLAILIKMFPEESSFSFTRQLKMIAPTQDAVTFEELLKVAKIVVEE